MAKGPQLERGMRTAAVKEYLTEHPSASPKTVVAALKAEKGIVVSEGLVSVIKYRKPNIFSWGRRRGDAGAQLSASDLIEAKRLVDALGGIEKAREALITLEQLK
ncbi:MAG: hypothetical protein U0903_17275 [Planctomycetales bacterium]